MNQRPVEDERLQRALDDCKRVFARYGYAGMAVVISPQEAAFFYAMHAPWSAIRFDPDAPLGWRIRARSAEDGVELTHARIEAAVHTVCQLADIGAQTMDWMEQVKAGMRKNGIEFDHTPFGGDPLRSVVLGDPEDF
jgi:hypothetical protein